MQDTVIVVNDEPDIRKLIKLVKIILTKNNSQSDPDETVHIEEAARLVSEHFKPDVIRLDIKMTGLDPVEICKLLDSDPSIGMHSVVLSAPQGSTEAS